MGWLRKTVISAGLVGMLYSGHSWYYSERALGKFDFVTAGRYDLAYKLQEQYNNKRSWFGEIDIVNMSPDELKEKFESKKRLEIVLYQVASDPEFKRYDHLTKIKNISVGQGIASVVLFCFGIYCYKREPKRGMEGWLVR
jgi:hypothetical protein